MKKIQKNALLSSTVIAGVALFAAPAFAQTVPVQSSEEAVEEAVENAVDDNQTIVITGSRVARPDLQASSPVAVVGAELIENSGEVNIENILNELPQTAPGANGSTNNGTDGGIATIDLRDLGASRTLVLMNGRRMVGSNNSNWVDLNNIPAALIERIDIVTGGASAVYGSDAVAGVVNFIMKDDFEGVEFGANYEITERGDGETYSFDVTVGGNFADGRGNAVLFGNYAKRESLLQGDRDFSVDYLLDVGDSLFPLGSSRIPGGVILVESTLPDGTVVGNTKFTPDGTPIDRDGEAFNFNPTNYIQTPQDRYVLAGFTNYEISDSVEFYAELLYANQQIAQQLAPDANDIPEPPAQLLATIANPLYNEALQTYLSENFDADGDGVASIPQFRRRMLEVGPRETYFDSNTYRGVGGFRGDIADSGWYYDAYASYGRNERSEELLYYTSDLRIQQALLVDVLEDGSVVCQDQSGGCVPIRLFGDGGISPEGAEFISPTGLVNRRVDQLVLSGVVSNSSLFDLGWGGAGFAAGVEYREESAETAPDAVVRSGELGPGNDEQPTVGGYNVSEVFGELVVPLMAGLELEGAARYSDYSTVGGVFTWKAGAQWEVVDGIRFRGLYQRAIRAPNISELFLGDSAGADDFTDFCIDSDRRTPTIEAFCVASGVPQSELDGFEGDLSEQATTVFGGNPDLTEEKADTITLGVVLDPVSLPGFTATIDYYNITIDDAIVSLSANNIGTLCARALSTADQFCQRITRDPTNGVVARIEAPTANVANEKREGIDWSLGYTFDQDAFGGVGVALRHIGNYTFVNEFTPLEGADVIDCNGKFGENCTGLGDFISPKWATTTSVDLDFGSLGWFNQFQLIGNSTNTDAGAFVQDTGTVFYWDTAFTYDLTDRIGFTAGVRNLLDRDPPLLGSNGPDANTDPSLYDVFGRTYYAGVRLGLGGGAVPMPEPIVREVEVVREVPVETAPATITCANGYVALASSGCPATPPPPPPPPPAPEPERG
ncbi:TonB-dependent receptor domain-containing protein [Sphingomicrobium arenosum]|uniref:TonB-dependent receptor domain-containing protein n=1 Tax=Sphingomicrobium arenosum TaxID=2233861 RepID=UPI002240F0F8|nr:TonB-dependent receptor [Sphingomicrobium arenosum]